ncbi:MAG: NlpC/P60 family protein [Candidatus Jorgensenbacteria bacterium]|nr:NlpC/P60 family protein [Candidatus Jorgensenbacteria bacterium]
MDGAQKEKIVALARGLIGKPYKYGASLEEAPDLFDCSSLIQYLFHHIGIELGRSSILQASDNKGGDITPSSDLANLEVGDLIFTRGTKGRYDDELFGGRMISIGHVALFVGNGNIMHSRPRLGGVTEQPLTQLITEPHYEIVLVKRF